MPQKGVPWRRYRCTKCGANVPHNLREAHACRHVNIADRVGDWWQSRFELIK